MKNVMNISHNVLEDTNIASRLHNFESTVRVYSIYQSCISTLSSTTSFCMNVSLILSKNWFTINTWNKKDFSSIYSCRNNYNAQHDSEIINSSYGGKKTD